MNMNMNKHNEVNQDGLEAVKENLRRRSMLKRILGGSKVIKDLHKRIESIAGCDVSVLITGESGTGKELAARVIHYLSKRASGPFVPVNCGAIPENLFENELFGHVKGAFTDARQQQGGLVEEAGGGTLFLDEIGIIAPYSQVKLLRLLQDKEYKRLGDSKTRSANIRIVAATNEDLCERVKKGIFREDLYYRLNIVAVHIPPLRERKEDIPMLAEHFIEKYALQYGKPAQPFSDESLDKLLAYHWPGNVRELENKIQQSLVLSAGPEVEIHNISLKTNRFQVRTDSIETFSHMKKEMVEHFEKEYLTKLLKKSNGDMVSAAAKAGKSRTALWNMLAKYNLHPSQFIRRIGVTKK